MMMKMISLSANTNSFVLESSRSDKIGSKWAIICVKDLREPCGSYCVRWPHCIDGQDFIPSGEARGCKILLE